MSFLRNSNSRSQLAGWVNGFTGHACLSPPSFICEVVDGRKKWFDSRLQYYYHLLLCHSLVLQQFNSAIVAVACPDIEQSGIQEFCNLIAIGSIQYETFYRIKPQIVLEYLVCFGLPTPIYIPSSFLASLAMTNTPGFWNMPSSPECSSLRGRHLKPVSVLVKKAEAILRHWWLRRSHLLIANKKIDDINSVGVSLIR